MRRHQMKEIRITWAYKKSSTELFREENNFGIPSFFIANQRIHCNICQSAIK